MSDAPVDRSIHLVARLPPSPLAVRTARQLVRSLTHWAPADQIDRGELVISEIVTNAVRYAPTERDEPIEVELTASRLALEGAVRDTGARFVIPPAHVGTLQIGGFGLHIVQQLANSLSIERTATGNCVRFSLSPRTR